MLSSQVNCNILPRKLPCVADLAVLNDDGAVLWSWLRESKHVCGNAVGPSYSKGGHKVSLFTWQSSTDVFFHGLFFFLARVSSCAIVWQPDVQRYPNGGCWILRIRKKAGQTNTSVLGKMWQVRAACVLFRSPVPLATSVP